MTPSTVMRIGAALITVALALLLLVGFVLAQTGLRGPAAGVALALAIIVYDVWHKGNPIGPVLMGLCRFLVYVTAAAATGVVQDRVLFAAGVALSYLIGLTYAAKQEDLTQPGQVWPFAFLAVPLFYGAPLAVHDPVAAAILALFVAAVARALWLLIQAGRPGVPRAVATLIAAICLLDGLFIAGQGHPLIAACTIAGFAATLALQRLVAGT